MTVRWDATVADRNGLARLASHMRLVEAELPGQLGAARERRGWVQRDIPPFGMPAGYKSARIFRKVASVIMTLDEFRRALGPHVPSILEWHAGAYKRRDALRASQPDQWADQDAATRGRWVHNLVVAAARDDESDCRRTVPLGGFNGVEISDGERIAAMLRFRRVEMHPDMYGDLRPVIPAPLTDTADDWFGNQHLRESWQLALSLDGNTGRSQGRPHTNLLIGHTSDPITGELRRIVGVCFFGGQRILWWDYLDCMGSVSSVGPERPGHRPSITPVKIEPRRREQ